MRASRSIGRFMRRYSLDELPQLFNVLQGHMSLVGPRPHAVAHNEEYRKLIKGYMVRHKVPPGITGLAQINGCRGETARVEDMQARIDYDLEYLRQLVAAARLQNSVPDCGPAAARREGLLRRRVRRAAATIGRLLEMFGGLFASEDRAATRADRRTASLLVLILVAGAVVRFWGLGDVGLHGDEKTMALPTMHLVQYGTPQMPSGMYYARAVGQLYLMAASVEAFGKSEWALRLPSAVCGVLLIVLTWTAGRRFLTPAWSLALAAAVAFLPSFIEDAQTARMYVFLTTSVAGFMSLVFAWERTSRLGYLLAAVAVMLVGLQFHTLAVFAAFIVLIPGLLRGDARASGRAPRRSR